MRQHFGRPVSLAILALLIAGQFPICAEESLESVPEDLIASNPQLKLLRDIRAAMKTGAETGDHGAAMAAVAQAFTSNSLETVAHDESANNLNEIKNLYDFAEKCFACADYRNAIELYKSVARATVQGSEIMAAESRDRLIQIEKIGKAKLTAVKDADLKSDYAAECKALLNIIHTLPGTDAEKEALALQVSLRSRPAVAAQLDLEQARDLELQGSRLKALALYESITLNPRYASTVAVVQASKTAAQLRLDLNAAHGNDAEIANQSALAKALLLSARNLIANHLHEAANEKLQKLLELYPNAPECGEARQLLDATK